MSSSGAPRMHRRNALLDPDPLAAGFADALALQPDPRSLARQRKRAAVLLTVQILAPVVVLVGLAFVAAIGR